MRIEYRSFHGPTDWEWINSHLPIMQVEDTSGIIAVDLDTEERVGALVLDNWTNNSVQGHFLITSAMVLKHGFLELCSDYIFNASDKKVLYAFIPSDNKKAIKLDTHIGFTEVFRMKDGFADGVDYVVMQLLKENCVCLPKQEVA